MPTATNFVQDYAAKRAAQMERARKIREERQQINQQQQQQQQPSLSHSTRSNGTTATASTMAASPPILPPAARSSRIANVVEDDFKRATKAGIITPDQARQLWAMLSDQIVQVDHTAAPNASVGSSSHNMNLVVPTTQGSPILPAAGSFGNSISLDSLRASIAQFKEKQKRQLLQQQQLQPQDLVSRAGGGDRARAGSSETMNEAYELATRVFAPPPAGAVAGTAGAAMSRPARRELCTGSGDRAARLSEPVAESDANEWGVRRGSTPRGGRKREKQQQSKRPAWNFDVEIGGAERDDMPVKRPVSRQQRGSGGNDNSSSSVGGGGGGMMMSTSAVKANQRSPVQQQQSPNPKVVNAGKKRGPTTPPQTSPQSNTPFDEIVVGGGGGNDGARSKADSASVLLSSAADNEPLISCSICGRSFRSSILARHEDVCARMQKKRRVFNTKEQRLDGIEGIHEVQKNSASTAPLRGGKKEPAAAAGNQNAGKLPKWKIQHEQFQAAMRAIRQVDVDPSPSGGAGEKGNGPVGGAGGRKHGKQVSQSPPPPLPDAYDDRVPCPHCGRKFAELTAQRHIPKCMTTIAKPKGIRPTRR